ncbi:MAG: hypothetical protein ACYDDZ_15550 [Acidimicrobiales bacterium]
MREAHQAVEDTRARGQPAVEAALLQGLRDRYDTAVAFSIIHNRLRDFGGAGYHLGYALGCWLREHADRVWPFTTAFEVEWTSNSAEPAAKGPTSATRPSPGTGTPHPGPLLPHPQLPRLASQPRPHYP